MSGDPTPADAPPKWKSYAPDGAGVYITEGKARIKFPTENEVFYNPVQEFNRDMSIAAITAWSKMFLSERVAQAKKGAAGGRKGAAKSTPANRKSGAGGGESSVPPPPRPTPSGGQKKVKGPAKKAADESIETTTPTTDDSSSSSAPPPPPLPPPHPLLPAIPNAYIHTHTTIDPATLPEIDLSSDELINEKFTILEALSASGLRAIRYAKSISNVGKIVANDLLQEAVDAIAANVRDNAVEDVVVANKGDAAAVMYQAVRSRFDVIDLDPYGSVSPFTDAAVQAVSDGGLLCITCTDMAVLAGSQPDACWAKYGGMPIPNAAFCHDMALRILLQHIQTSAARYRRNITPLASFSIDFYVRVFVRVDSVAKLVKKTAGKSSMVYNCTGCRIFVTQPIGKSSENGDGEKIGPLCGPAIGGPFYNGPIHDPEFVARMLQEVKSAEHSNKYGTRTRMLGMLTVVAEELPMPFYYDCAALSQTVKSNCPPLKEIFSALLNMGYKVSTTHASPNSIKTNAPGRAIWDMMRAYIVLHPITTKNFSADAPGKTILSHKQQSTVSFAAHPASNPPSRTVKLVRYQINPTKNWGPMARAGKKGERGIGEAEGKISKTRNEERAERHRVANEARQKQHAEEEEEKKWRNLHKRKAEDEEEGEEGSSKVAKIEEEATTGE
ncbi:RNA methyltransferase tRNA(m5U54)methyltransferase [Geranomyces variabilis]|uniref:tRNA (guanine(26)-N(2))-dimethyltransferase n=1 Tax=Geranomyces variabilis TaxID=109894 RepID=A0AAD5XRH6_9FUNG|nr:RNA methyltransferase tRNA(m5U54)methyltransferase [Geranomyces variabilis]